MSLKSLCLMGRPRFAGELDEDELGVEWEGTAIATLDVLITDCD